MRDNISVVVSAIDAKACYSYAPRKYFLCLGKLVGKQNNIIMLFLIIHRKANNKLA